jgi:signal transduction histidine kinase
MRVEVDPNLIPHVPRITLDRIVSNILGNALDHAGGAVSDCPSAWSRASRW